MIVSDAVFSMDGELANLPRIGQLADQYGSVVMIDECHGTGVLGARGRGAIESTDMLGKIGTQRFDIICNIYIDLAIFD